VGEHFFQLPGALFAVPCMSIAQTIFLHFRESTMGLGDPLAGGLPADRPRASATPPAPRPASLPPPAPVAVAAPSPRPAAPDEKTARAGG
jgi:hypothetical protein